MHKYGIALSALLLFVSCGRSEAAPACTLILRADTGQVLTENDEDGSGLSGACDVETPPASTFKIALSLMGYDAGILIGTHAPALPYLDEYQADNEVWKQTTYPKSWMADSVVWYSQMLVQKLTEKLGEGSLQEYVDRFDYGNRDLSGSTQTKNVWIGSSLKISPRDQAGFLRKFLNKELPVSPTATAMTRSIIPNFRGPGRWIVHGKTGTAFLADESGNESERQLGWFIGWASDGRHDVIFVRLIQDDEKLESRAGLRARDEMLPDLDTLLPGYNLVSPASPASSEPDAQIEEPQEQEPQEQTLEDETIEDQDFGKPAPEQEPLLKYVPAPNPAPKQELAPKQEPKQEPEEAREEISL